MEDISGKYGTVILKPERDKHVRNKHPWVFMGAIKSYPSFENGNILAVKTAEGVFVGYGYFNRDQSIAGRMISFAEDDPIHTIKSNISKAVALRDTVVPEQTSAYRLINGEGDDLPGLVVDRYGQILVIQVNTLGMEKLKPVIVETLTEILGGLLIYEKSSSPTRRREGLADFEGWILGGSRDKEKFVITEHGLKFEVLLAGSQKTGLFLDQREMRNLVRRYAQGKRVLNCFSYTGGFSVYAKAGKAAVVDSVDISQTANDSAKHNFSLNGFDPSVSGFYSQDVAEFLNTRTKQGQYDFIILDPPAFAKRASDVRNATRGYVDLNMAAMNKLDEGGLLLTSSCSSHIGKDLFQTIVFNAAKRTGKKVRILSHHILAADHPVNLFYPEGDYLKSLLLYLG